MIVTSGLISARVAPVRLNKLTIINKSGRDIEISLTGEKLEQFYYLRVAGGSRLIPVEKIFTVVPDNYSSTLYYVEILDPVYGYQCESKSQNLDLNRNVALTVIECDRTPANAGEKPVILKYGGQFKRGR